jgi:hypothetical protein
MASPDPSATAGADVPRNRPPVRGGPGCLRVLLPGLLALLIGALYTGWRLAEANWDPLALAELGSRYALGAPDGSPGYDGQFNYYIASALSPQEVVGHLDVPAYRYQRILYPLLGRLLALARPAWIPWTLLGLNLVAHALGTAALAAYLEGKGLKGQYALSYGLWVGLIAPVGLDLNEPLSYSLVIAAWLLLERRRSLAAAACLGLALFAKETALIFWLAALAAALFTSRDRRLLAGLAAGGLAFAAWQLWLLTQFGRIGLGSGGDMATPFEWIPFMGLWRVGTVNPRALVLFLIIFGPTVVGPAIWGAIASLRTLLAGSRGRSEFGLLFSSAAIMTLPFSTFREPLGLVRAADGLVLAVVFFASGQYAAAQAGARRGWLRPVRLALFWIPLLAILLNR